MKQIYLDSSDFLGAKSFSPVTKMCGFREHAQFPRRFDKLIRIFDVDEYILQIRWIYSKIINRGIHTLYKVVYFTQKWVLYFEELHRSPWLTIIKKGGEGYKMFNLTL